MKSDIPGGQMNFTLKEKNRDKGDALLILVFLFNSNDSEVTFSALVQKNKMASPSAVVFHTECLSE